MDILNNIPINSTLGFIGLILLLFGAFMILAGLDVISVQQVTVKKGRKTWVLGVMFALVGCILLFPDFSSPKSLANTTDIIDPTKTTALPIVAPTVVLPTPTVSGPREISWKDAKANIGETAKICGNVVTVASLLDGRTIINVGELPKNGGLIVVVTDSSMFLETELNDLYNENICVTGEIVQDDDNIGIYVTTTSQIESNLLSTTPSDAKILLFRDDFTEGLQVGWKWQNENPSRWEITPDGWLQILGEDVSLLGYGTQNNLLCRDTPDGDFQITVHVYANPSDDYQQAALYLYQDGDNFVAINRGYCSTCATSGNGLFMEFKSAGSWDAYNVKTQDPDVSLRLVSQGTTITGYYASDDEVWQNIGKAENYLEQSKICLGVTNADSAGITSDLVGRFDYIEISKP